MRSRILSPLVLSGLLALGCTAEGAGAARSDLPTSPLGTTATTMVGIADGEPLADNRCEANRDAGTIRFLTGFDLAAASSIVDVITADEAGYYDELCLDVEIVSSVSSDNYVAVAAGDAEFASGGSFSELVARNDPQARLLAATVEGRTSIDTLIVRAGDATELSELTGSTIGVKGAMPPAIDVMLRSAGLVADVDYRVALLDGLDPVEHLATPEITAIPGWKSNEVGVLERAGVGVALFDPLTAGVPGSFGLIFTSETFVSEHPTAAQDFVRATMRGLADAVADPDTAATAAVERITASGNPEGLSLDGEIFRWRTEAALILDGTPEGLGLGVPDTDLLQAELDAYADVGLFGNSDDPIADDHIASDLLDGVYGDDETVVWPS